MIDWPTRSDAAKLSDEQLLEKLQGFGLEVDRAELERLCEGALSAEEVALPLLDRCGAGASEGRPHEDWIWLCLLELWRRWWPERVCVEFLGDKIQAGYDALERQEAASAAGIWLDAWSDVVRLCDLTGDRLDPGVRRPVLDVPVAVQLEPGSGGRAVERRARGSSSSCARGSRCARRRCGGSRTRTN